MGALTETLPKPMLPLQGKPILEHVLERLLHAGLARFLLVVGYRAEIIEKHFSQLPFDIAFVRQDPLDGTARAALLARDFAASDPFLLTFGDILAEPRDYTGLREAFTADPNAGAVLGVKQVDDPCHGAAVYEKDGIVTRIVEKPPPGTSATRWNSAGLYIFRPSIFPEIERVPRSPRGEYELTSALENMIAAGKRLRLYPLQGAWGDIGRPEDLESAISTRRTG